MRIRIIKEIPYEECGGYLRVGHTYNVIYVLEHDMLTVFDDYANRVRLTSDEYEVVDDE